MTSEQQVAVPTRLPLHGVGRVTDIASSGTQCLLVNAEGQVWVWRIPGGDSKVLGGSGERVECGDVMQDGRRAVAGFSDGTVKIWDMKSSEQQHSLTGVHSEAVVNLTLTNTNLLLTGSSDGSVGLWNCSNGQS